VLDNATAILGEFSEPQPDGCLLLLPECGGQTRENEDGYLAGAPELVAEVASSSESYDLHSKKRDYERAGVREYVVVVLRQARVDWFVRGDKGFAALPQDAEGVFRSPLFCGLWLDVPALLRGDTARVHEVLRQGLASPEHARLLEHLKKARSK
jgi:Uma2 family endonuclease